MIVLIALAVLLAYSPRYVRSLLEEQRKRRLANQLRESLQSIVNALRSGSGLMQAIDYTAREGPAPLNAEWKLLLQSIQWGQSWTEALDALAARHPIREMKWFVTAVQITQSTGGSLADVLETLASTLQEQQTLREKISALTAQGKASGILLTALPFLMLAGLYVICPAMVTPMFTTMLGQFLMTLMLALLAVGGVLIQKIVSIRVE